MRYSLPDRRWYRFQLKLRQEAVSMRAVVTGAASGIGRATAERLLREGVEVLAVDIREPAVEGAESYLCDVGDPAARERLAADAGAVDYLVNAAGIILMKPIWEVTVEEWR